MAKKAQIDKDLHVLPTAKGDWAIKAGGSPKPLKVFSSKNAAKAYAKSLVVVVDKKSGSKGSAAKKAGGASSADIVVHTKAIFQFKHSSKGKVSKVVGKKSGPQFGSAKGKFVIAPDFNEIPQDFHDYVE
jgi:hypothetical protein